LLFARRVLANKFLKAGGVPANKFLKDGGVPANKFLKARGVPANKFLKAGRVPANNLFLKIKQMCLVTQWILRFSLNEKNQNPKCIFKKSIKL
jgi:hypothetical protein